MASTALNTSPGKENVPPVMTTPLAFSHQPTLPGIETSHLPSNPMQLSITGSASSDSLSSVDNMHPSKHQCTADVQHKFNSSCCWPLPMSTEMPICCSWRWYNLAYTFYSTFYFYYCTRTLHHPITLNRCCRHRCSWHRYHWFRGGGLRSHSKHPRIWYSRCSWGWQPWIAPSMKHLLQSTLHQLEPNSCSSIQWSNSRCTIQCIKENLHPTLHSLQISRLFWSMGWAWSLLERRYMES